MYSSGKLVAEYSTQFEPVETAKIAYTTTDHLGSPRIITDDTGTVRSRRDFMPFGEELHTGVGARTGDNGLKYASETDNVRQKFTGYQKDAETSLDFAEARMYENRFGRFTAVDPLLASGNSAEPQSFNRYAYVVNNPLASTDPTGQCRQGECPTAHYGTVYYKNTKDRGTIYNDENEDDTWQKFGGDALFSRDDGKGWAVVSKFGWYTVSSYEAAKMAMEGGIARDNQGFGRSLTFSDQLSLSFSATGKSGYNGLAQFSNLLYKTVETASFGLAKMPRAAVWAPVNKFEQQQMFAADMSFLAISLFSTGGARSASSQSFTVRAASSAEGLPIQTHHFATIRNQRYTPQMADIANEFGLSLKGSWNTQTLPHLGRHPNAYHNFVLNGMQNARNGAGGSQAQFLRLFDLNVKQPVIQNPQLLRRAGWR